MPIDFGAMTMNFKVTEVTTVRFGFWTMTSFRTINLKLAPGIWPGSGQLATDYRVAILNFGVTGCKKVKDHFWHLNSKPITVIILKLGADACLRSGKMNL